MKILIDAGHRNNSNDFGASGNGLRESALALAISQKLKAELEKHGIIVFMSRESESDVISLEHRTTKANNLKVDLYVSVHINAFNGQAAGIECLYYADDALAKDMTNRMCKLTNARSRGAKQRKDLHVLRETKMDAVLVECGFIDNPQEGKLLADEGYQDKLIKGIVGAIISKYKIVVEDQVQKETPIMGLASATVEQCKEWARSKKAKQTFIDNLSIYFNECIKVGVNPIVAVAQYAKETGYGKFGGVLTEDFKNPCGLKETASGKDDCHVADAHKRFKSWEDGISAHIDHLALYAAAPGYPKQSTLDPRHFSYLKGKAKTVEELSGNWCPSDTYGQDLLKMMQEIEQTKSVVKDDYEVAVGILVEDGIINSPDYWLKCTDKNTRALIIKMANHLRGRA